MHIELNPTKPGPITGNSTFFREEPLVTSVLLEQGPIGFIHHCINVTLLHQCEPNRSSKTAVEESNLNHLHRGYTSGGKLQGWSQYKN